ncbi:MAG: glycosyl hydrolase family 18 protein [Oscillospiraceae bacterium]|nr:glycosyl hydrolase family 18 protein [Oscillospiraceae bacterium]
MLKKVIKRFLSAAISAALVLHINPSEICSVSDGLVKNLFSGSEYAKAWSTAVTISSPDTSLLNEKNMISVKCDARSSPALVLQSWTGQSIWAKVFPCANIDDTLYYSYEDMKKSFSEDLKLVNALNLTAQNTAVTVYDISVVTREYFESLKSEETTESRVVGYLPDWSYSTYRTLDFSALTHINIAFCNPDTNGNLSCYIPDNYFNEIVDTAHKNGVKVLASLGGAGGSGNYPALIRNSQSAAAFSSKILEYVKKYDLDGIDLDIEGDVDAVFWDYYADWVSHLRTMCSENNLLITSAVSPYISAKYSNETLRSFDFLNIMAYDNDLSQENHSTYNYAIECLDYFRIQRGVSGDKLVLGVPFYGRGFDPDTGYVTFKSYMAYKDIIAQSASYADKDLYNSIAYNGTDTIRKKCDLASGYGGIMIWEISQDAQGDYSLLSVIKDVILKETQTDDPALIGDINLDSSVTAADMVYMKEYLLGVRELSDESFESGDINQDGQINIIDFMLLKAMLLKH